MLLIGLVGTGCSGSGSPSPSATSGRLDAAAGGTVRLGLAAMEVPAGALSVNATASIRQVQDPPSVPVGLGTAYGFSLTPFALRPGKTVRLHLPIPDGVGTQGVQQALAYRDEKGQWIAVTATVDPNGKTATADVPHLSTWAFFDIGSWLTNTIKNAVRGHLEAAGPSVDCPGPTPYVSVESLSKDAPLAVCVQPAGPRRERVTLVNKRKFAVAVTPGVGLTRPNDFSLEVGQGFTTVPSAGQLTFELDSSVPATKVSYRPDYQYTAVETLAPALLGRAFLKNPGAGLAIDEMVRCTRTNTPPGAEPPEAAQAAVPCAAKKVRPGANGTPKVSTSLLTGLLRHLPLADLLASLFVGGSSGGFTIHAAQRLPPVGGTARPLGGRQPAPSATPTAPVRPGPAPAPVPDPHAPPTHDPKQQRPIPAGAVNLGGVSLEDYCQRGWGLHAVVRYPVAWGWQCGRSSKPQTGWQPGDQDISVDDACTQQYGHGAWSHYRNYDDPYSWVCYRV